MFFYAMNINLEKLFSASALPCCMSFKYAVIYDYAADHLCVLPSDEILGTL